MAVRRVLSVQDKNEEFKLRRKSNKVPSVDRGIINLIADMLDTLYEYDGVGLAAPQIGVTLRIVVIHLPEEEEPRILINPQIVKCSGEMTGDEGCLSVPGYAGEVTRYANITVKALNINGKEERHKTSDPLFARALQHELDHLDGVMYYDRMSEDAHLKPVRRADEEEEPAAEEAVDETAPAAKKTAKNKATSAAAKTTAKKADEAAAKKPTVTKTTAKKAVVSADEKEKPAAKTTAKKVVDEADKTVAKKPVAPEVKTAAKKSTATTSKTTSIKPVAKGSTKKAASEKSHE